RAIIEKDQADDAEDDVRRPGRDPGRDASTFAESEKKMHDEIHRENQKDRRRHARQNTAPRITDTERARDQRHYGAGPGQRDPVLQMRRERREQRRWKIGIELK